MSRARGLVLPIVLLALLVALAWLQYRWTGEISRAEKERLERNLRSSVARFSRDVDEEIALVFRHFRIDASEELADRFRDAWDRYGALSPFPDLIENVYYLDAGGVSFALRDRTLEPAVWPQPLSRLRRRLESRALHAPRPALSTDPPALAVPLGRHRRGRWARSPEAGHAVVLLDSEALCRQVFPELVARHFGSDYDVAVVAVEGADRDVWFTNASEAESVIRSPDAQVTLLSPRAPPGRTPPGLTRARERRPPPPEAFHPFAETGGRAWMLFVRHRAGSLEQAVAAARMRNLVVSFGILGLLGASVVLVTVSTRRASELNDRKMEFVAGVSHELRTPLAVLRSAGQNLADGSVREPEQVKRYGVLIETEGRRLNDLVERVLELAGIQSQKRRFERAPVSARELVENAVADCETEREASGVTIETRFPDGDTRVFGDAEALRRGLGNLIGNAIKHGGAGGAVTIDVETRGDDVRFIVTDRGPGIPDEDRGHIFEAFYRGRLARNRQVPGSGLGLSLVEHIAREHGGSVALERVPGDSRGSRFVLSIPGNKTP